MRKQEISDYYENEGKNLKTHHIDKDYRGLYKIVSTHAPRRALLEKWLSFTKPRETFLDVGAELGYFVREMAQKGLKATGVDLSPTKVRKARYIAQKLNIKCKFLVMNAENLEFEPNSFDWVLCSETLEHVLDDKRAINELLRVSKRNLIITVPQKTFFWRLLSRFYSIYRFDIPGAGHLREYTRESILNLFDSPVKVKRIKSCNFLFAFLDKFLSKIPIFQAILCLNLKKIY